MARITLKEPCPNCGEAFVYIHDDLGENVRKPALYLDPRTGCSCKACHAFWPQEELLDLARLLGFEIPKGIYL